MNKCQLQLFKTNTRSAFPTFIMNSVGQKFSSIMLFKIEEISS